MPSQQQFREELQCIKIMLNVGMSRSVSATPGHRPSKDVLKREQLNNSFSNNELWSKLRSKAQERNHSSQRRKHAGCTTSQDGLASAPRRSIPSDSVNRGQKTLGGKKHKCC
ncbi:rCG31969, partial [Rattus norvegicus]